MRKSAFKNGWTRVAFGDVVQLSWERSSDPAEDGFERYVGLDHLEPGDLKIRRWGDIADGTTFTNVFRAGQVLFGKRRAYQRKVAVSDFDGVCSGDIYVLEPRNEHLLPELLPFICQTEGFFEHAVGTSAGSLSPRTNWESLASYEFALPPLEEQRRIAEVLSAAELLTETLSNLRESLYAVEVGLLEKVMLGVPDSARVPVAELLREPPRNGISPNANIAGKGLKTVSISAVSEGLFEPNGCIKHAEIDAEIARPFFVQRGDAFVIRGNGNRQLCGKVGLSEQSYDELFYPDLLIRLRFETESILPEFAVAQWNLPSVHGRLSTRAKSSNGIWKINGQDIRAHRLFAPAIAEQRRVMDRLAVLRAGVKDTRAREIAAGCVKMTVLEKEWG
ncbi:MAG: restriction endonuclease subunit S [Candidatus Latescibacteria bacterium]|nr:restriction endonuclease subunit S [Candidatus Latescibacterota bacterium]